jgi:membrane protein DedA with SNARE-associated domain
MTPALPFPLPLQTRNPVEVVSEWAIRLMETLGGPGAGLAVALENIFPPLPSELILPLAGFTASRGQLGLVEAVVWTTLGSLVGALGLYAAGRALGRERVRRIAAKMPLVSADDVDRTHDWFDRHGSKAVFFGRMLPLFRSFISIPAGVEAMSLRRFALLTTAGSLIWNTAFILAGFALGENWHVVEDYAGVFQAVVIGAVVVALAVFVTRRVRSLRRPQNAP